MNGSSRPHRRRRMVAFVAAAVVVLVVFVGWWGAWALPVVHLMHADVVTQTSALFDSDPDRVQRAIDRSGKTDITISAFNDPGNHRIFLISGKRQGLYFEINEPAKECGGYASGVQGACLSVAFSRKPFTDPSDADTGVDIGRRSAALDQTNAATAQRNLRMSKNQIEALASGTVWEVLDTVADNWR
jgi:hypothetical protein